jgi:hypothetical protein
VPSPEDSIRLLGFSARRAKVVGDFVRVWKGNVVVSPREAARAKLFGCLNGVAEESTIQSVFVQATAVWKKYRNVGEETGGTHEDHNASLPLFDSRRLPRARITG